MIHHLTSINYFEAITSYKTYGLSCNSFILDRILFKFSSNTSKVNGVIKTLAFSLSPISRFNSTKLFSLLVCIEHFSKGFTINKCESNWIGLQKKNYLLRNLLRV